MVQPSWGVAAVVIAAVHKAALHPRQQRDHLGAVVIREPAQRFGDQFIGQAPRLNDEDDVLTVPAEQHWVGHVQGRRTVQDDKIIEGAANVRICRNRSMTAPASGSRRHG